MFFLKYVHIFIIVIDVIMIPVVCVSMQASNINILISILLVYHMTFIGISISFQSRIVLVFPS